MATPDRIDPDDWELINDDGFVYKRKKRLHSAIIPAPPQPDPEAENIHRRKRRKIALTKLKRSYQNEIDNWELLSNTLQAMFQKTQQQKNNQQTPSFDDAAAVGSSNSDVTCRRILDDLLAQEEVHETIISDLSNLCNVAEALCDAQEERLKQSFIDLPIWAPSSPNLIKSLCDE